MMIEQAIAIGLNRVHFPVTALGPGRRIGIWFQGCSIGCRGCMSLDTWAPAVAPEPLSAVFARLDGWLAEADGVTISGGEPFEQPEALYGLLLGLKTRSSGSVLVYSGNAFARLQELHADILAEIDVVITEPFDDTRQEPTLLRGSSNQVVNCLTDRGIALWQEAVRAEGSTRSMDVVFGPDGGIWLAGIPRPGDLERLSEHLATAGLSAKTSAGRIGRRS